MIAAFLVAAVTLWLISGLDEMPDPLIERGVVFLWIVAAARLWGAFSPDLASLRMWLAV